MIWWRFESVWKSVAPFSKLTRNVGSSDARPSWETLLAGMFSVFSVSSSSSVVTWWCLLITKMLWRSSGSLCVKFATAFSLSFSSIFFLSSVDREMMWKDFPDDFLTTGLVVSVSALRIDWISPNVVFGIFIGFVALSLLSEFCIVVLGRGFLLVLFSVVFFFDSWDEYTDLVRPHLYYCRSLRDP